MDGRRTIALLILSLFLASCFERKTPVPKEATPVESEQATQPLKAKEKLSSFVQVQEMLSRNCTPCHEPGGKMYERLPFDNPDAVRSHSSPILIRINKPEDKKLMEDWLSEPQN